MQHFRNFLCLVTQESVFPEKIFGVKEGTAKSLIQVLYQIDTPINNESTTTNSLLSHKDIENTFITYVQNWYHKYDELEPVLTLYFGIYYGRFVYLNLKFICLVQAIEAYHRRMVSNEELPENQHKERITRILSSVSSNDQRWLKGELTYSNEPSLRKRLNDIFNKFAPILNKLIPDEKYFINKVVNTRNYMTHYDSHLKEQSAKHNELFVITEKLRIMVEICLLKEIGLTTNDINKLVYESYHKRLTHYQTYFSSP
jgi:hypothetical protein